MNLMLQKEKKNGPPSLEHKDYSLSELNLQSVFSSIVSKKSVFPIQIS